ncbi:hypothetical protein B1R32_103122 [Abditibacterium utsteinense]|uniref:Tetratricopeptide repeat-containing protein n=1 Tax=Abditibacterium utsteinense TaxID=1960156 RepID=A0A2S8SVN2_9BACT|nr:tetratricopeptide repeat protein [Abditibacterium utsteinense]PQV64855.1 hypothetical protein B1R32_103122 [Abditibacterium utsteinense]
MTKNFFFYRFALLSLLSWWLCSPSQLLAQQFSEPQTLTEWMQSASDNVIAQNYEDARHDYTEAARLARTDEEKATVQFGVANVDLAQLKFKDAQTKLLRLLAEKTTSNYLLISVKMTLGQSYAGNGQYKEARATFRELADAEDVADATKVTNQLSIAQTFIAEKKYEEAQLELEKIRTYSRTVPSAQVTPDVWVGRILVFQKQWDKARVKFADALRVNADTFSEMDKMLIGLYQDIARLENALSFEKEGNKTQAKNDLQALIERPQVAPQVLAEAKKQLKILQLTEEKANEVK